GRFVFAVCGCVSESRDRAGGCTQCTRRFCCKCRLGGEGIVSGRSIPAAPERMASASLNWRPGSRLQMQLTAEHVGRYWLDARNSKRYNGHTLAHLSGVVALNSRWELALRLRNLFDRRYAERADYAFGGYRYFPGAGRSA